MKKSIAILSIFLLLITTSCRDEINEVGFQKTENIDFQKQKLFSRDSIPNPPSSSNSGEEPPRKDTWQWRQ
jgi:hypothetical protein